MKCPKKGHVAHDDGEPAIGIRRSAATYSWPRGSDHRVRNPGSQTLIQVSVPLGSHQRRRLAGDPRCGSKMGWEARFSWGLALLDRHATIGDLLPQVADERSLRQLTLLSGDQLTQVANRPAARATRE